MDINKIVVGSESALKIRAVTAAFQLFSLSPQIIPCKADSGIGSQPIGTNQMEKGARGRVHHAQRLQPGADLYIGIENGLVYQDGRWYDPTCIVIDSDGSESVAFGAYFPIPTWMVHKTTHNKSELGEIVKELAGGGEKDPMAYLSKGHLPREQLLSQAVCCALTPLLWEDRYAIPVEKST